MKDLHSHTRALRTVFAGAAALMIAGTCAFAPTPALAATSEELQSQLESASSQLESLMSQTDASISALQATRDAIDQTQVLIDESRVELDSKAQELASKQDQLSTLIANDYKDSGTLGFLGFFLGAHDFDDLISRMHYAECISEHKQESIDEVRGAQTEMLQTQQELQNQKAELEALAAEQEAEVGTLQAAQSSQRSYVSSLPTEIQSVLQEEHAERLAAAEEEAAALIEAAEADKAAAEAAAAAEQAPAAEATTTETTTETTTVETPTETTTETTTTETTTSTPESQPADSSGGNLSDVADYIGPQASWSSDASYIASQQGILNSAGSGTNWGCVVDTGSGRCTVFRNDGGAWKAAMTTDVITTGHTFTGNWSVVFHSRAYWQLPDGYDVNDWWVCFIEAWSGDNYNGHLRYEEGKGYDDGQGFHYGYSSGGCTVIPSYSNAQWLYDHVPDGSRVVVY